MKSRAANVFTVCVLVLGSLTMTANAKSPTVTLPKASAALQEYLKRADDSYAWRVRQRGKQGSGEFAELILTSQTWHDIVWKHQLFIYKPAKVDDSKQALLLIDGGSWSDSLGDEPDKSKPNALPEKVMLVTMLADMMQTPVVVVKQVPEQPIFDGKKEDQIIALTFAKFFETGESDWPLLLPMVKAAIRGMDTAQKFAQEEWQLPIEHFTVTGASKRGWTTWLTAASDPRVNALAPMVINMLNMEAHDALQLKSFGKYSEQIQDYTDRGLQKKLSTDAGKSLRAIVDPIAYRDHLKQPKLIVLATNDEYWPVDSLNLYWDDLEGEKYVLYVPNNGHGITDYPRVTASIAALQKSVTGGKPMPKLSWDRAEQSDRMQFKLTSDVAPSAVRRWTATADSRDFRKATWKSTPVKSTNDSDKTFATDCEVPKSGYAACFMEAEYPGEPMPFVLTTTLHVVGSSAEAAAAGGGK